jgi:hypothetical protein
MSGNVDERLPQPGNNNPYRLPFLSPSCDACLPGRQSVAHLDIFGNCRNILVVFHRPMYPLDSRRRHHGIVEALNEYARARNLGCW